jgi:RimJ/RimL family protein N-acetyltransferase
MSTGTATAEAERIGTVRLSLRPLTADDAVLLFELDSDAEVMRYLNGGKPTPMAVVVEQVLPAFMARKERLGGPGCWIANERASGGFAGWFGLRPDEIEAGAAELGYRLRRQCWGRGLASEGAAAVLDAGFTRYGLERIVATTYEENARSRRVLEKLGFELARRFRLTPDDVARQDTFAAGGVAEPWDGDDLEYVLTRDAWEWRRRQVDG